MRCYNEMEGIFYLGVGHTRVGKYEKGEMGDHILALTPPTCMQIIDTLRITSSICIYSLE